MLIEKVVASVLAPSTEELQRHLDERFLKLVQQSALKGAEDIFHLVSNTHFQAALQVELVKQGCEPSSLDYAINSLHAVALQQYATAAVNDAIDPLEAALTPVNVVQIHQQLKVSEMIVKAFVTNVRFCIDNDPLTNLSELVAAGDELPQYICYDMPKPITEKRTCGLSKLPADELYQLYEVISQFKKLADLIENMPSASPEVIEADRLRYGAKGAYHIALQRAVGELEQQFSQAGICVEFPDFTLIPADQSVEYRDAPEQSADVCTAYQWIEGREVILRSSAVYSEDGASLGAGIYTSVVLRRNAPLAEFCQAIKFIYDSLDSDLALAHRERIGFSGEELMGIVVQEWIEPIGSRDVMGHINTVRPQMATVCEVCAQERFVPTFTEDDKLEIQNNDSELVPFRRSQMFLNLISGDEFGALIPNDYTKNLDTLLAASIAKLGVVLELYFKTPLQVEYVQSGGFLYPVQARPLPAAWLEAHQVKMPMEENYIWRSRSFGVIDEVLDVLPADENNWRKKGVVIFDSSKYGSEYLAWLERVMPGKGAVVVLRSKDSGAGHIESRCAERGVVLISGDMILGEGVRNRGEYLTVMEDLYGSPFRKKLFEPSQKKPLVLEPNERFNKLRVVSTGFEARIFYVEGA